MKKKGWTLNRYHDTLLYQGLYFDVDYDNADYNEGATMLWTLLLNECTCSSRVKTLEEVPMTLLHLSKD